MSRPIAPRNPQFYSPEELLDSLYPLLREVPTNFVGVYLSSTGEGLKWITHRPGNFAPNFPVSEMRPRLPNATDQRLHAISGYREAMLCIIGLCKLWKHFDQSLVDPTGQVIPEENQWIFDPTELALYDYVDWQSGDDVIRFIQNVPRIRLRDYTAAFTTQDFDFRYANAMYSARDNLAQGQRLNDDSGVEDE